MTLPDATLIGEPHVLSVVPTLYCLILTATPLAVSAFIQVGGEFCPLLLSICPDVP